MRFLSRLIPRSTGGRWALGTGLAAVVGVGIYLVFFLFAFHLIFVDEVVDEEGPEFAVEADIDALISEALDTATTATVAAGDAGETAESEQPVTDQSMSVGEHADESARMTEGGESDPAGEKIAKPGATSDGESAADADEPAATAPATTAAAPPPTTEAEPAVRVAYVGSFGPRSHPAEGTAVVLTDGTQTFLRFDDDFATDNGPDLNVYLHTAGPDASVGDLVDDFIDLGDLKGNIGAQNYVVPAGIDLDRYNTVSVWCVRFRVVFGTAELVPMN
ncbi:DM13 domain-containing protein [Candidatus Poriferisodalis multihospitum]|uniref:DM13 domain-containing protein n=1 Tax=Candidatus Poriferisodalis multihospitum TaxID=2983191 RepID=UPI002386F861|nr:DM13 domain-containing protein [Candidatus Poriferisodalis multihospitum]MDE0321517.1 DM13 domain-containing protein [Acidimicrobiaceae bacterium]